MKCVRWQGAHLFCVCVCVCVQNDTPAVPHTHTHIHYAHTRIYIYKYNRRSGNGVRGLVYALVCPFSYMVCMYIYICFWRSYARRVAPPPPRAEGGEERGTPSLRGHHCCLVRVARVWLWHIVIVCRYCTYTIYSTWCIWVVVLCLVCMFFFCALRLLFVWQDYIYMCRYEKFVHIFTLYSFGSIL